MQPAFVARVRAYRRPVEARGRLRRQCVRLRVGDDPHTPGVRGDRSISVLSDPLHPVSRLRVHAIEVGGWFDALVIGLVGQIHLQVDLRLVIEHWLASSRFVLQGELLLRFITKGH